MINNETIKEVISHKHMGTTLYGGLGWNQALVLEYSHILAAPPQ